jgi:release factor glutamine methyltransferase
VRVVVDATEAVTVGAALAGAIVRLRAVGVPEPEADAQVLAAHALGTSRAAVVARSRDALRPAVAARFEDVLRRRETREPVAYIVGEREFWSLPLAVDCRVLIPRPETELLVELALELGPRRVLDVGTGSGAVALAIADELPECEVVGTDPSAAALEVARANTERLGFAERVRFVEGTLPDADAGWVGEGGVNAFEEDGAEAFDLVVANLPYVAEADWAGLQPEVTEWEPREALLAGHDGLDGIRTLLADRVRLLSVIGRQRTNGGGGLALEVGIGQASVVNDLLLEAGFAEVETRPDLAGIPRLVWCRR